MKKVACSDYLLLKGCSGHLEDVLPAPDELLRAVATIGEEQDIGNFPQ